MSAETGIRVANVFHAGDGNLHPLILFDGREPGAVERAEHLASDILRLCVSLGGSITGEHGVGVEKRAYLSLMFSEDDLDVMRRIRHAVDPAELSNRGKMLEPTVAP
jgi:glycolate oxidase